MNLDNLLPTALSGILVLLAIEALVLVSRRPLGFERVCSVIAGGCLLTAWRAQLAGAPFALCGAILALAGACHVLPWFVRERDPARSRIAEPRK
jgi:hypothetical protein